jgi:hypothetical protein
MAIIAVIQPNFQHPSLAVMLRHQRAMLCRLLCVRAAVGLAARSVRAATIMPGVAVAVLAAACILEGILAGLLTIAPALNSQHMLLLSLFLLLHHHHHL